MTQDPGNPYSPPVAAVFDTHNAPAAGAFIPNGRKLPAGNGSSWIGSAWRLFRAETLTWILIWVVFALLVMVAAMVPMGSYLLPPLLTGGIMLGCERLQRYGMLEIGDLFSGFRKHTGPLLIQGLLYLAGVFVVTLPVVVIAVIGVFAMSPLFNQSGGDISLLVALLIALMGLLVLALMLPVMAATWFAPALIVLHDMQPMDAMKQSFRACFKNWLPMTIYSLLLLLLICAGLVTCCLGFLVVGPLFSISVYTSYRDIFFEE